MRVDLGLDRFDQWLAAAEFTGTSLPYSLDIQTSLIACTLCRWLYSASRVSYQHHNMNCGPFFSSTASILVRRKAISWTQLWDRDQTTLHIPRRNSGPSKLRRVEDWRTSNKLWNSLQNRFIPVGVQRRWEHSWPRRWWTKLDNMVPFIRQPTASELVGSQAQPIFTDVAVDWGPSSISLSLCCNNWTGLATQYKVGQWVEQGTLQQYSAQVMSRSRCHEV